MERKKSKPSFSRWMLGITSASAFLIGPIIIGLGYESSQFVMETFIADKALIMMGLIVSVVSILSIYGTISFNSKFLLFSFYSYVILVIFVSVFSIGAWMMIEEIQNYIDRNWDSLRETAPSYNMIGFKIHAESEIQSLVSFSFTVVFLCIFAIGTIWTMITKKIKKTLLPVTSLILSILGSALVAISIYTRIHTNYTEVPLWSNYVFTLIGLVVMILGVFGYKNVIESRRISIIVYAVVLGFASLFLLAAGIGSILLSGIIDKAIQENWNKINANLTTAGYDIQIEDFIEVMKINFKLGGLFGVINFLFFLLSFVSAILYIKTFKA